VGRFLFEGVSWAFYTYLLEQRDRTGAYVRITYDRGRMEVLTGADVQAEMSENLTRMLELFNFKESTPYNTIKNRLKPLENQVYVISPTQSRAGAERDRVIEINLMRAVLEKPRADGGFDPGPPDLSIYGRIEDKMTEGYPGISVAQHFAFLHEQKDVKK
jgi:hypothetical protein